jgi:cyclopropane fatty-acyl-phospholipid synthase-like methyltransferase
MSEQQRWETRFGAAGYLFGKEPNAFLRSQAHRLHAGASALAVADGEGRNGVWLAEQGLDVLSIDYSPTALAKAKQLAQQRGVRLCTEIADVTTWPWPKAAFDVIVAIFIAVEARDQPTFFQNLKAALKPGGLLLMQSYRPEQLKYKTGGPPDAARMWTREILQSAFGDLAELDIREHDSVIEEGTAHIGMSALIDLIGKR